MKVVHGKTLESVNPQYVNQQNMIQSVVDGTEKRFTVFSILLVTQITAHLVDQSVSPGVESRHDLVVIHVVTPPYGIKYLGAIIVN